MDDDLINWFKKDPNMTIFAFWVLFAGGAFLWMLYTFLLEMSRAL